jgi:hypothetical protein
VTEKRSFLTRIKHALFGKPITHEEQRAANASLYRDARVDAHHEANNHRFGSPGF